jgi:hypothetical protein
MNAIIVFAEVGVVKIAIAGLAAIRAGVHFSIPSSLIYGSLGRAVSGMRTHDP